MEPIICSACDSEGPHTLIGILGNLIHLRCRACGIGIELPTAENPELVAQINGEDDEVETVLIDGVEMEVTGDACENCGKTVQCVDTRDVDGEEVVMCRDCAMEHDDSEMDDGIAEDDDDGEDDIFDHDGATDGKRFDHERAADGLNPIVDE